MAKVTGIGGVFFKSTGGNTALAAWYSLWAYTSKTFAARSSNGRTSRQSRARVWHEASPGA